VVSFLIHERIHFESLKSIEYPNIAPANMWTRKDLKEFKDAVRKEKDAVIKIGSGETVTVGEYFLIQREILIARI